MAEKQHRNELFADQSILSSGMTDSVTRDTVTMAAEEDLLARNIRKRAAIDHLDRMVTEKVAWKKAADMDFIEEELVKIAHLRQSERDSFNTQRKPRHKAEKTIEHKEADTKLDAFVDVFFARAQKGSDRIGSLFTWIYQKTSHVFGVCKTFFAAKYPIFCEKAAPLKTKLQVIIDAEAAFSDRIGAVFGRFDDRLDRNYDKAVAVAGVCNQKQWNARCKAERYKRPLLAGFAGLTAAAAAVTILIGSMTAYEYMYNGEKLGVVKDQQDVYTIVDAIGDNLTYAYGAEIHIDKEQNLTFKRVIGWNLETDSEEEILNTFTYMTDMNAEAYGIFVDGKQVAVLDTKKSANALLNQIKDKYTSKSAGIKYKSVGFAEDVKVGKVETKIKNIQSQETALEYMMTGATEKKVHAVASGETFGEIAKNYGMKASQLEASNPDVKPDTLKVGQELVLTQICPVLTVATTEIATYNAKIDYGITYKETSTLYKGEETVKSSGVNGQKEVVAEIVRENGIEVSRTEISATVLSEPVNQVVLQGTKPVPPLIGTGTYIYPVRGATLSSRFGMRWGRLHSGIDLAASSGTWIYASDGGTVISAGWDGQLGKCVKISHGGNRVTVYGHCSKLLVKAGDKVFQGQHIANVGNTGKSTGPHCHFEVRINGNAKNPLNYL